MTVVESEGAPDWRHRDTLRRKKLQIEQQDILQLAASIIVKVQCPEQRGTKSMPPHHGQAASLRCGPVRPGTTGTLTSRLDAATSKKRRPKPPQV
jgi:hypothetical protein